MSYAIQKTEGVILQQIPFQNYDQILTLFTLDHGLIKLLNKGGGSKKKGTLGISVPLTRVEVVYTEKNSDIFFCNEIHLLDSYLSLRNQIVHMNVGCDLLKSIQASQFLNRPAPLLYRLLSSYLSHIKDCSNPWTLAVSLKLKLLRHDGLSPFPLICTHCHSSIFDAAQFKHSGWFCCSYEHVNGMMWNQEEIVLLYQLVLCQNFKELQAYSVTTEFQKKVSLFFDDCLKN